MPISFLKRLFIGLLALLFIAPLNACGFQPLYANGESGLGAINIKPIEGRIGYLVGQQLSRKFGDSESSNARVLKVTIKNSFSNAALGQNSFTTRTIVTSNVNYELEGIGNNPKITGSFSETSGYDVVGNAYGEVAFAADAEDKLSNVISDRIWLEILRKSHNK